MVGEKKDKTTTGLISSGSLLSVKTSLQHSAGFNKRNVLIYSFSFGTTAPNWCFDGSRRSRFNLILERCQQTGLASSPPHPHFSGGICRFLIKPWRLPSAPPADLCVSRAESTSTKLRGETTKRANHSVAPRLLIPQKWVLIIDQRKSIHEKREAGLSPSASASALPASIRLLSLHTEVAEKFNYLSPTSLSLLSSPSQTYEMEFPPTDKAARAGCCSHVREMECVRCCPPEEGGSISFVRCAQTVRTAWSVAVASLKWFRLIRKCKTRKKFKEAERSLPWTMQQCSGAVRLWRTFWWAIDFSSSVWIRLKKKKVLFLFSLLMYKKRNECRRCVFQRTFSPRLLYSESGEKTHRHGSCSLSTKWRKWR